MTDDITGIRVPWNASWTSEERFEVRPCRFAGGRLAVWQPFTPGNGKPVFAKPHQVRQRRSIAEMRCTVCGEKTVLGDRWWFRLGTPVGDQWTTTEAPVHRACADHALEICPHLRALGRQPERMPGGFKVIASLVGGPAMLADMGIDIGDRVVVGSLKLAWPMLRSPNDPDRVAIIGEQT